MHVHLSPWKQSPFSLPKGRPAGMCGIVLNETSRRLHTQLLQLPRTVSADLCRLSAESGETRTCRVNSSISTWTVFFWKLELDTREHLSTFFSDRETLFVC